MSTAGLIVTFVVVWWLVFFTTLPFGVRPQDEPVPGSEPGAPERPYLWIKALVATVIAAAVTFGLDQLVASGAISLRPAVTP